MKKDIITLKEQKLDKIIKETIKDLINTHGVFSKNKEINVGDIITISNITDFEQWYKDVWNLLIKSYEDIGGIKTYHSINDFYRKQHLIELILDKNSSILACATYRRIEGSLKLVATGCEQSQKGKLALQQIIQNNIINADLQYWAEVSGAIEYYFKKHNGYPMPNTLASEILKIDANQITLSKIDKVHYDRPIGSNGEIYTKMIFGIKNEEIFNKAIKEVENYGSFMKEVNKINESINTYTIKQAIYIIENIYRAHEEDGYNELIPSWHEALIKSLNTLKNTSIKDETIEDYISYCEYLLEDMQVLQIHELSF